MNSQQPDGGTSVDRSTVPTELAQLIVLPGENEFDTARSAWNLCVDQRPAAVGLPSSAQDIAALVGWAKRHGLTVAAQATGHGARPMGPLHGTLLLKTERMRSVQIDEHRRVARVQAGALWQDVTRVAAKHGLAALSGSSPDVGVLGYCLGGGLSWFGRRHGLACNSVISFDVVLADGSTATVDSENEPDLYWALRGGGGNFAIVPELELALQPINELYAGSLFWPLERASEVLTAWRDWCESVPEDLTSCGRLLSLPPIEDIPEPFRGKSFVSIEVACLCHEGEAIELLAPLRALHPELDTFAMIDTPALSALHMDPEHPVPGHGDGALLSVLSDATIETLVRLAGPGSGSPLLSVELRHCGGALATPGEGCGALGHLDGKFALFAVGIAGDPATQTAVKVHIERLVDALAPWRSDSQYANFVESTVEARTLFDAETWTRLLDVKRRYDPLDVIRANHRILATADR